MNMGPTLEEARTGSCAVGYTPPEKQENMKVISGGQLSKEATAAAIGVTPEKLQKMRDYAAELKRKYPQMKENRIKRKTAEYFKIKLT